jgi:hypothetical protein
MGGIRRLLRTPDGGRGRRTQTAAVKVSTPGGAGGSRRFFAEYVLYVPYARRKKAARTAGPAPKPPKPPLRCKPFASRAQLLAFCVQSTMTVMVDWTETVGPGSAGSPTQPCRRPASMRADFVKSTGPALTPESRGPIDVVLLSHEHHSDNLDPDGRAFLPRAARVLSSPSTSRAGPTSRRVPTRSPRRLPATGSATACDSPGAARPSPRRRYGVQVKVTVARAGRV